MSDDPPAPSSLLDDWIKQRASDALDQDEEDDFPVGPIDLDQLLPADTSAAAIRSGLAEFVQGQVEQLAQISVLLSMHLQWMRTPNPMHTPPNAVVVGPTGSGKTFTFRTAADMLRLPFISVDTTALVPSGIVGLQIEDVVQDLVTISEEILDRSDVPRTRDDSIRLAERGILFLDEFDKISTNTTEDIAGNLQVQRRLLKLCEGAHVSVGVRSHTSMWSSPPRSLDTRGLLIIATGAFEGVEKARASRPQTVARRVTDREQILSVDLINFGFIPELIARLPVLIRFGRLGKDELLRIMRNDAISPLTVWSNYVAASGATLVVTDDALEAFADRALETGLGARGLQQVIFPVLSRLATEHFMGDDEVSTMTVDGTMVA